MKKSGNQVGKIFSFLPVTPNQWSLISIFPGLLALYYLIDQNLILAALFYAIAGFLDIVDGAVSRYRNISTKSGAYLDTICDRYVEGFLLLGMLFLPLPEILVPHYCWISLILFGSLMTTYAKAAAREKELVSMELKGGLLGRSERVIFLLVSLILGVFSLCWMSYFLIIAAILTNFTALQRIFLALKGEKLNRGESR